ncbi:hypothetical protein CCACVL1_12299 [Corchorus capsularis]|uniref:BHLH domain-containing protein n=1 Tax=Corchorus capsularis TaxID=210143 RepID=A0A1R3IGG6_COCAP|nr:hypothetical protein CCACVL1_12299 [Corchorus capsularis]
MCALAPFPTPSWPLVNPIGSYEREICSIESLFLQIPPPPSQEEIHQVDYQYSPSFTSSDPKMVRKLNHNASERDRRKKVNNLYSSLRSLLPAAAQMKKKLSFPATVSQALKYIPELQKEVERLIEKKEKVLERVSKQGAGLKLEEKQRKSRNNGRSLLGAAVSIKGLTESEVAIHITMAKAHKKSDQLSEILQYLEQDGMFLLLNATSFESFGGMVFYNIHLQVERIENYKVESEVLSEKLLSLNKEETVVESEVRNWLMQVEKTMDEESKRVEGFGDQTRKKCFQGLGLDFSSHYLDSKTSEEDVQAVDVLLQQVQVKQLPCLDKPQDTVAISTEGFGAYDGYGYGYGWRR